MKRGVSKYQVNFEFKRNRVLTNRGELWANRGDGSHDSLFYIDKIPKQVKTPLASARGVS